MIIKDQKNSDNNKVRVLLIDEDPQIGCLIKGYLKSHNCTEFLGQAYRGMMGVEMVQETLPGLVIIDLHVPGSSGFDLLSWVKETYPNTKVIVISNSVKPEYKMIAESLGANYFLDKHDELHQVSDIVYELAKSLNCEEESSIINKEM